MGGWWGWRGVLLLGVGGGAGSHPHPALSLKGEGKSGDLSCGVVAWRGAVFGR